LGIDMPFASISVLHLDYTDLFVYSCLVRLQSFCISELSTPLPVILLSVPWFLQQTVSEL